jgi:hypothetical protein
VKQYLADLAQDGFTQDWTLVGGTQAWQTCLRGSGDASYIYSGTFGQQCWITPWPAPGVQEGFVTGISFHCRVRTTAAAGGGQLDLYLMGAGLTSTFSFIPTDDSWVDLHHRFHRDATWPAGMRFSADFVNNLNVIAMVGAGFAPPDRFEISEMWLVVEYCDTLEYYDPVTFPNIPSAMTQLYLLWSPSGTEAAVIDPGSGLLSIEDNSAADWRLFYRTYGAVSLSHDMESEICQRVALTEVAGTLDGCCYRIALDDGTHSCWLAVVRSAGQYYLGLTSQDRDIDDLGDYFVVVPYHALDGTSDHLQLSIARWNASSLVQVYLNYADVPVLQHRYQQFSPTVTKALSFGTGDATHPGNQITALVDFVSWRHWQTQGARFADWRAEFSEVNRVDVDGADPYLVRPVALPAPYPAGSTTPQQSPYCCSIQVSDNTEWSSIKQPWWLPTGYSTCDITIQYRMDTLGTTGEFLVQRTDDHLYWNQAFSNWVTLHTAVPLPCSLLRTTLTVATGVTPTVARGIIVWVRSALGSVPGQIKLYHVHLKPIV